HALADWNVIEVHTNGGFHANVALGCGHTPNEDLVAAGSGFHGLHSGKSPRVFREAMCAELVEILGGSCLHGDGHIAQALRALSRGDNDFRELPRCRIGASLSYCSSRRSICLIHSSQAKSRPGGRLLSFAPGHNRIVRGMYTSTLPCRVLREDRHCLVIDKAISQPAACE